MNTPEQQSKKKVCILTKILLGLTAVWITLFIVYIKTPDLSISAELSFEDVVIALLVVLPLMAVISLIRISLNSIRLKGRAICFLILVLSCLFIYLKAYDGIYRKHSRNRTHYLFLENDSIEIDIHTPANNTSRKHLLTGLKVIIMLAVLTVLIRYGSVRYSWFILLMGVLSAVTGRYFGKISEEAYIAAIDLVPGGGSAGIFFGLVVGVGYGAIMAHLLQKHRPLISITGLAVSVGIATGIICATLVHISLMITTDDFDINGILIGIPYGVGVGAVLGLLGGFLLKLVLRQKIRPIEQKTQKEL